MTNPNSIEHVASAPQFLVNEDAPECSSKLLWIIIAISLLLHVGCLILSSTVFKEWRWENHPIHTATEISGSLIALMVAGLLISLDRTRLGTSFNVWISAALVGMGLLDGLHALVYVGQPFVWLHSLATLVGGLLFNMVWLPKHWMEKQLATWWVSIVFGATLLIGVLGGAFPEWTPAMLVLNENGERVFSSWAVGLNVGGGLLLILSSVRLLTTYLESRNTDDLLFCLHCVLFGAAATMFQQSQLWDLTWWGWHALRLLAYAVALWFIVLTVHREQKRFVKLMFLLENTNNSLELQVRERTTDLTRSHEELEQSYVKLQDMAAQERRTSGMIQGVMNSTIDAIITFDVEGGVESVNNAATQIFGLTEYEMVGSDIGAFIPNTTADSVNKQLDATIEKVAIRRGGTSFPSEVSFGKLDGQNLYTCTVRDITARKHSESELAKLNRELISASRKSGMADVASGVIHNVGNAMNSILVTATQLREELGVGREERFAQAVDLLKQNRGNLAEFVTKDPKGQHLINYLQQYATYACGRQGQMQEDINQLLRHVAHAASVISMQQRHTQFGGIREDCSIHELMHDALLMALSGRESEFSLVEDFCEDTTLSTDRHKTVLILVNLIRNAKHSVLEADNGEPTITLKLETTAQWVEFQILDSGVGFSPETGKRLFELKFTTKNEGHGFGLHSSANAAKELDGSLSARSDGEGKGACFTLRLPFVSSDSALEDIESSDPVENQSSNKTLVG